MLLKYSLTNSLTLTAMTNLFKLINTIFKSQVLPESSYIIDKLLNPKEGVEFHAICHVCNSPLGKFGFIKNKNSCTFCNAPVNLDNPSNKSFFALINPSNQISDLINAHEKHYKYVTEERVHETNYLLDVYDGKAYRNFIKHKKDYLTANFNTDGAEKFKCSHFSIWPIFLSINELPSQVRFNKPVTCGLWFNKKKPDMTVFLDKFTDLINKVTDEGIPCTISNEQRLLRLYVLTCCCDAPARCQVCGMSQFNAEYGCPWCLHRGESYGGSMRYRYLENPPLERTHEETVKIMVEMEPDGNPILGIKYPSPLINLKTYNFKIGLITDYLHIIEGLAAMFATYHFDPLTESDMKIVDDKMMKIAATQQIGRLTTPISNRKNWKAREWENYILYYSAPILLPLLSPTLFNHWLLLVESLYILLKDRIHIDELNKCYQMLDEFVKQTENLYDVTAMTFNLHQLLHITENVLNWGPLWTISTFSFESANYYLLRAIKASKGVTQQIIRFISINHKSLIIEKKVIPMAKNPVVKYCNEILAGRAQHVHCSDEIMYFHKSSVIECIRNVILEDNVEIFLKCVKDHCLYESHLLRKTRSDNTIVKLKNGIFVRIICFVIKQDEEAQLACNVVNTRTCFDSSYEQYRIIENIIEEVWFTPTRSIERNCVSISLENKYICPVPNTLHY